MAEPINMDIYESSYFKMNKKFLIGVGLWPYAVSKTVARYTLLFALMASCIPQILAIIIHPDDVDRLMLSVLILGSIIAISSKLVSMVFAENNLKELYESLAENWKIISDDREKAVLIQYAKTGKILTVFYAGVMGLVGTTLVCFPLVSPILDMVYPLSTPRERIHMSLGEYFIEREKHFVLMFFVDVVPTVGVTVLTISVDTMYVQCSLQCCALLTVIRQRLQQLRPMGSDFSSNTTADTYGSYNYLIQTILLHRTVVNFASILNNSYSMCFLYICVVNIILIPLDACAVLANVNKPYSMLSYLFFFVSLLIHLFILFWPGQQIKSHGEVLYTYSYDNMWYETPRRTTQLFMIFMLQCSQPLFLTAGGIIEMNFETYAMIMKTAVSYITVLASFRPSDSS